MFMQRIKEKFRRFVNDDSGMEVMEVGAIALGAVILIAAIAAVYNSAKDQISEVSVEDAYGEFSAE